MSTADTVVAVVGALAWPLTVLVAAAILRGPIISLLGGLRSVRSMKIAGFEMEFAEAVTRSTTLSVVPEFRRGPYVNESSAHEFLKELSSAARLDEAIVELGTGREWITSRLFLLATLLHRMRGLRTVIFIGAKSGRLGQYLGQCDVERLRWRLSARYGWLERAMLEAELEAWNGSNPITITSDTGRIESAAASSSNPPAAQILTAYIQRIQQPAGTATTQGTDWVELEYGVREHAEWVSAELLDDLLDGVLDRAMVLTQEFITRTDEDKAAMIVAQRSPLIAVGTGTGAYESMLDREKLLEQIVRQQLATVNR